MRAALVVLFLVLPACASRWPHTLPYQEKNSRFLHSHQLGVTKCVMPVVLDKEDVQLHIWIRLSPGSNTAAAEPVTNTTSQHLYVKGFAMFIGGSSMPQGRGSPQLMQAKGLRQFEGAMYLRSPYSKQLYPLSMSVPERQSAKAGNPMSHDRISHVIDVWATIRLDPSDSPHMDFQLRMVGVEWHCIVLAEPAVLADTTADQAPQQADTSQPVHDAQDDAHVHGRHIPLQEGTVQAEAHSGAQAAGAGMGTHASQAASASSQGDSHTSTDNQQQVGDSADARRTVLAARHARSSQLSTSSAKPIMTDAQVMAILQSGRSGDEQITSTSQGAAPRGGAGGAGGADASRGEAAEPVVPFRSSLGPDTQVWLVLSPFYKVSVRVYAQLLAHHVLWHTQLGVTRYLLYVTDRLAGLLHQPIIKALIGQGQLQVVLFTELSKHEVNLFMPGHVDNYMMQVLVYNHALLALWGGDHLVLVSDLDEFLLTARPGMQVVQAFQECADGRADAREQPPVAGLQVQRREGVCPPGAACEMGKSAAKRLWTSSLVADVAAGRSPHPLLQLSILAEPTKTQDTKALLDPNMTRDMHVHTVGALPGAACVVASPTCMLLLHLKDLDMSKTRVSTLLPDANLTNWLWPAHRFSQTVMASTP